MYKDPIYFYFIVPIGCLAIQLILFAIGVKIKGLISKLFEKKETTLWEYTAVEVVDNQTKILKQGESNDNYTSDN